MKPVLALTRRAIAFEIAQYRSLFRWVSGRPDVPTGAVPFAYIGAISALLWVFVVVSAIELVALHLLIPWETIRLLADILSLWGLIWMFGFMAGFKVHPHLVTDAGLRIRTGSGHDIAVPWDAVEAVTLRERTLDKSRTLHVDRDEQGATLSVAVGSRTNVDVTLGRPLLVPLRTGPESVTAVRFYVDDARGLVGQVRQQRAKQS